MTQGPIRTAARRMKKFRTDSNLSAEGLAEQMRARGIPWRREVVANLETGRRDRLDVDELLALALVFGVPPMVLLVDPAEETAVIALGSDDVPATEVPATTALRWLSADSPLEQRLGALVRNEPTAWTSGVSPVRVARDLDAALQAVEERRRAVEAAETDSKSAGTSVDAQRRQLRRDLLHLSEVMAAMAAAGYAVPPLPGRETLDALAAEHDVELGITRDPDTLWPPADVVLPAPRAGRA